MDFTARHYDQTRYANASQFSFGEGTSQYACGDGSGSGLAGHGGSGHGSSGYGSSSYGGGGSDGDGHGSGYGGSLGGHGGGYAGNGGGHSGQGSSVITINCPRNMVGRVCGPRGSRIQEIRQRSHARIDIENQCAPGADYQEIRISGPQESMQLAANLVSDAIRDQRQARTEPPVC